MTTYISILRGINLGGHNTIKMDALKKLFADIGFANIQTYIQSGNIVYQYKKTDIKKLDALIKKEIKQQFGYDVPVITLTFDELKKVAGSNPFLNDKAKDTSYLHVTFLADKPQSENFDKIKDFKYQSDEFQLIDKAVYLYCPNGYGNTKLSNNFFESKLKVTATTRNWKTTNELISIAGKINN
jgi:uncharacterized protein (DUF1697 family)